MKNSQIFKNAVLELDSKGYTREFIANELGIDVRQFIYYSTCMREPSDELVFKLLDKFYLLEKFGFKKDDSVNNEIEEEAVNVDVKEEPFIDVDEKTIEEEKVELEENDDIDIKLFLEKFKSLTKKNKKTTSDFVDSLLIIQRNDQSKEESEEVKHDSSTVVNHKSLEMRIKK